MFLTKRCIPIIDIAQHFLGLKLLFILGKEFIEAFNLSMPGSLIAVEDPLFIHHQSDMADHPGARFASDKEDVAQFQGIRVCFQIRQTAIAEKPSWHVANKSDRQVKPKCSFEDIVNGS